MFAAGELAMTPRDLAKWDISMIDQHRCSSRRRIASWRREIVLNNGAGTGYGWASTSRCTGGHRHARAQRRSLGLHRREHGLPRRQRGDRGADKPGCRPASGAIANGSRRALRHRGQLADEPRRAGAGDLRRTAARNDRSIAASPSNASAYFSDQALKDFAVQPRAARHADRIHADVEPGAAGRHDAAIVPGELSRSRRFERGRTRCRTGNWSSIKSRRPDDALAGRRDAEPGAGALAGAVRPGRPHRRQHLHGVRLPP